MQRERVRGYLGGVGGRLSGGVGVGGLVCRVRHMPIFMRHAHRGLP